MNPFSSQSNATATTGTGTFSFSSSFSASTSSSSTRTGPDGIPRSQSSSYSKHIYADPSGATVRTSSSRDGGPPAVETRRYDVPGGGGRRIEGQGQGGEGQWQGQRRIEDVTDEVDNGGEESYEDKMEGEYAKQEGGA